LANTCEILLSYHHSGFSCRQNEDYCRLHDDDDDDDDDEEEEEEENDGDSYHHHADDPIFLGSHLPPLQ